MEYLLKLCQYIEDIMMRLFSWLMVPLEVFLMQHFLHIFVQLFQLPMPLSQPLVIKVFEVLVMWLLLMLMMKQYNNIHVMNIFFVKNVVQY